MLADQSEGRVREGRLNGVGSVPLDVCHDMPKVRRVVDFILKKLTVAGGQKSSSNRTTEEQDSQFP